VTAANKREPNREKRKKKIRTSSVIKSLSKKYEDFHALVTAANKREPI